MTGACRLMPMQVFNQDDMKVEAEGTVSAPADLAERYVQLRELAREVIEEWFSHSGDVDPSIEALHDWLEANL
jgi:hypothetical protein